MQPSEQNFIGHGIKAVLQHLFSVSQYIVALVCPCLRLHFFLIFFFNSHLEELQVKKQRGKHTVNQFYSFIPNFQGHLQLHLFPLLFEVLYFLQKLQHEVTYHSSMFSILNSCCYTHVHARCYTKLCIKKFGCIYVLHY